MRRNLTILIAIGFNLISGLLVAQTNPNRSAFAPVGSSWSFVNQSSSEVPSYQFIASNDTIINGINALRIQCSGTDSTGHQIAWGSEIMYGDNNKVYCLINNTFKCVYDFSEPVGTIHTVNDSTFRGFFQFQSVNQRFGKFSYKIIRKDSTLIDGLQRRSMLLAPVTSADWTFGINRMGYNQITEGVGCISGCTIIGSPRNLIRLNRVPQVCFPVNGQNACDSILSTHPENTGVINKPRIFPNPFTNHIKLVNASGYAVASLFDASGKQWETPKPDSDGNMDLSALPAGVFLMQLGNTTGNRLWLKVVKQ